MVGVHIETLRSARLDGKVALITGAARGMGRCHAVTLASRGADIIAVDICRPIDTVPYPLASPADLAETGAQVRGLRRRIVACEADVRDFASMQNAVQAGLDELGRIDIVVANAGISALGPNDPDPLAIFNETIAINLTGVFHTVHAAAPTMIEQGDGGAIVLISSTAGLAGRSGNGSGALDGYTAAKHGVVGLMRTWANWLGPHRIRVNTVHPTGVITPMVTGNAPLLAFLGENPEQVDALKNLLPVDMIESIDIAQAVAWLVSDEARYVTGVPLPVDAGMLVR